MLALLGLIPQIFSFGSKITDLLAMKAKAQSDKALKEIDQEIEAVRDKRAVLVAEAANNVAGSFNAFVRTVIGLSAGSVLVKLWFVDKVLGPFAGCTYKIVPEYCHYYKTDPLSDWELGAITVVIGFYFVASKIR